MKRHIHIIFVALCLLALFGMPFLTLILPHQNTSFYEQRNLAVIPPLEKKTLWDGSFFTAMESAVADRLAFRENILRGATQLNMALARPVVNNILVTEDILLANYGFYRWDLDYLDAQAVEMADAYAALDRQVSDYGGTFFYLGVPQQSIYFADRYPDYMDSRLWHTTGIRTAFSKAMQERGLAFIDMYAAFQQMGQPAQYYPQTDHHYTYEGAFATYQTLMERIRAGTDLPLAQPDVTDFDFQALPNPYLGSSNRKLYGLWKDSDHFLLATPKEAIPFTRTDNGIETASSVFALPESKTEELSYSLYMGDDVGETILRTGREDLPSVLIYGDSFTNPLETLLWTNFDETRSLDFRYYKEQSLQAYIAQYRPDVVICVRDESLYLTKEGNRELFPIEP